jgi:hypothetical protein
MVYDSKIVNSSSLPVNERTSYANIKTERSGSDDMLTVKTEVNEENEVIAMTNLSSDSFRNPRCMEESTSPDAACQSPQPNQVSEKNNLTDIEYRTSKTMVDCSLMELSDISEIDVQTNKANACSNEEQNQVSESKMVIQDHDYLGREKEIPGVGHSLLPKPGTNIEDFRGAFTSLTPPITRPSSLPFSSTSDQATNPVLVRCFNKNGTVFKLPLALLRSAVILQPYRVAKVGESLLRHPALKATPEPSINIAQSALSKIITSTSRPHISPKLDPNQPEKIRVEARFVKERKNCDAFFEKIFSSRWSNVRDCVRVLAREFCLINAQAEDPIYRSVHPYTSPSLEAFSSWSIILLFFCVVIFFFFSINFFSLKDVGKRRSAEWMRAKLIRLALEKCFFASGENIWTTKIIMNWCRMQGYSPMCCWLKTSTGNQPFSHSSMLTQEVITLTKTQIRSSHLSSEDDETIEVESLNDTFDTPSASTQCPKAPFLLNDLDPDLTSWIVDSIEKHGFKLGAELCENFLISFSRVLLSHVWKGITEDLLRRSLSESWLRTQGAIPDEISWIDTYRAISNRPQFDIFTNAGMGVEEGGHDTNSTI